MPEMLFEIADTLAKVYPALSPIMLRRERFDIVLRTVSGLNAKTRRESGLGKNDKVTYDRNGNRIIWREAKGDDWW